MSLQEETPIASRDPRRSIRIVAFIVTAKACLFLTVYLSLHLLPPIFDGDNYMRRFHWPQDEPPTYQWIFKTWDSAHYLYLSEEGYAEAEASAAFPRLWPALIRLASPLFGDRLLAALILANLLSAAGLFALHRLTAEVSDDDTADTTLLLTLAYPGAIYFCLPYTESLFLLITVAVFSLINSDRLGAAAWLSILAPATRTVGVFLFIPLAWRVFSDWRDGRRPWWHITAAAAPFLGMALTLGIMWIETGNAFASFEAQAKFASQGSITKIFAPLAFLQSFADIRGVHGVLHSAIDRVLFLLMAVGTILTARLDRGFRSWSIYSAAMILVPAMAMSMMAFTRYSMVVFPAFIGLGAALSGPHRREIRWLVLSALLIVQFFFLIRQINSLWAG